MPQNQARAQGIQQNPNGMAVGGDRQVEEIKNDLRRDNVVDNEYFKLVSKRNFIWNFTLIKFVSINQLIIMVQKNFQYNRNAMNIL